MKNKFSGDRPEGFYVKENCCFFCMAPHGVAPDLMGFDDEGNTCFISKQPESKDEKFQAIKILLVQCMGNIRYNGNDDEMKRKIVEAGEKDKIDGEIPEEASPVFRNIVQIHAPEEYQGIYSSEELVQSFMGYLFQNDWTGPTFFERLKKDHSHSTFCISFGNENHEVKIKRTSEDGTKHIISYTTRPNDYSVGSHRVMLEIDRWLREELKPKNIRWYSRDEWEQNEEGSEYPY